MAISPSGATVWRDYVTDGVPSSGANKPSKAAIRLWASAVETELLAPMQRLAQTSDYTIVDADHLKNVALGGGAFYTVSLTAGSDYRDNFRCLITNEDTARGKKVDIDGYSTFTLWPGQQITVFGNGTTLDYFPKFQRWRPPVATTLYVATTGDDTNDGLDPASPLLTPARAVMGIGHDEWDLHSNGGPDMIVQLADGNYPGIHFSGPVAMGEGRSQIEIRGNASAPQNVILTANAGQAALSLFCGARGRLKNVTLRGAGLNTALAVSDHSQIRISNVRFETNTGFDYMTAELNSHIIMEAGITIAGNAKSLFSGFNGGQLITQGYGITFAANSTFTDVILMYNHSIFEATGTTWNLGGFTVSGRRYYNVNLSMLNTGTGTPASVIPGSTSGVVANGAVAN